MNTKRLIKYLLLTYIITWICWFGDALLVKVTSFSESDVIPMILFTVGGFGPTIAACVCMEGGFSKKKLKRFLFSNSKKNWSFLIAAILNYVMQEQFWCNVLLGIFGGAVLTSITSIMGYFVERRHALEEFYLETIKLLKRYNKYQTDLTPDQKINFFLELSNYDMEYWGTTYARIDLFNKKSRKYICLLYTSDAADD